MLTEEGLDRLGARTLEAVAAILAAGMGLADITTETAPQAAAPGTVGPCAGCRRPARWLANGRCDSCAVTP